MKDPQLSKAVLKKNNKSGGILFSHFQLHRKAVVMKTVWHWQKADNGTE